MLKKPCNVGVNVFAHLNSYLVSNRLQKPIAKTRHPTHEEKRYQFAEPPSACVANRLTSAIHKPL